jgi:hypothetical protein
MSLSQRPPSISVENIGSGKKIIPYVELASLTNVKNLFELIEQKLIDVRHPNFISDTWPKRAPSHTVRLFIGHGGPELFKPPGPILNYIPDNSVITVCVCLKCTTNSLYCTRFATTKSQHGNHICENCLMVIKGFNYNNHSIKIKSLKNVK